MMWPAAPRRQQAGYTCANGSTVFMMRHRKKLRKLGRPADQRKALMRSLTTAVLEHGVIETTTVRPCASFSTEAHEVQPRRCL